MEIKIDTLVKAIKLIRSDNSDEFKKFFAEKHRFLKPVLVPNQQGYYPRQADAITGFDRRGDFNVLFVLLESLRYVHMSQYGYERDTTPFQ